jgi:hypothetical protein
VQILRDDPPSPRKLNSGVPRDLETICLKCLEKEPSRRYTTARELSNDLRRYLDGQPIHARPVSKLERGWRWTQRHPARAGLIAASAAALVAVMVGAWIISVEKTRRETAELWQARWQKDHIENFRQLQRQTSYNGLMRDAAFRLAAQLGQEPVAGRRQFEPLRKESLQPALEFWERVMRLNQDSSKTIERGPGEAAYDLAHVCALRATAAKEKEDHHLAEQYAERAVEFLRVAGDAGFFNEPGGERLANDPDFGVLQPREDFRDFLAKLKGDAIANPE